MWREEELFLVLSQDEAWELLSRCLNSAEPDNEVSRRTLQKLARLLQCAPRGAQPSPEVADRATA
jgi:hypothetical protein